MLNCSTCSPLNKLYPPNITKSLFLESSCSLKEFSSCCILLCSCLFVFQSLILLARAYSCSLVFICFFSESVCTVKFALLASGVLLISLTKSRIFKGFTSPALIFTLGFGKTLDTDKSLILTGFTCSCATGVEVSSCAGSFNNCL